MQIRKKHLAGIGGLALVAATFAYAVTIPASDAGAVNAAVSGQVKITVNVYGEDPEVRITSIEDGEVTVNNNITIGNLYVVADKLEYKLCKNFGTVEEYCADLGRNATYIPDEAPESGERAFDFDLDSDPNLGFGDYVLQVVNKSGVGSVEDSVSFKYVPLKITTIGSAENGDPIVEVEYASKIGSFDLQAYDERGKPLFDDPINVDVDNPGTAGKKQVTLPFGSYGAASGDYSVSAIGTDLNGKTWSNHPAYTDVDYKAPDAPEVPKTGGILGNLNIGRTDYLITGLIMFVIATAFAVRALKKRSSRR